LITFLGAQRIFLDQQLADRPALLLAALLLVLGLQIFALGLLGELIIFTHARSVKDYRVEQVVHYPVTSVRSDTDDGAASSNDGDKRANVPPAAAAV
jgi:hypothetical protein